MKMRINKTQKKTKTKQKNLHLRQSLSRKISKFSN